MHADNRIEPRALRRPDAARYLGVSPRYFDRLRAEGKVPPPLEKWGVAVWDRNQLDRLFVAA